MSTGEEGRKIGLKSKVSILVCLLVLVSIIYSAQIPAAHSWGWNTHRFIENKAERVFSDNSFFSNHHSTLYQWCIKPDQGWGGGDWHWLDAISYHPLITTGGELPWAVENVFDNIVRNLENKNWNTAAQLMGAICHYTGDSTNPLHATYDYSPGGHHGDYEDAVNAHLGEILIPDNYVPQELDNVFDAAMVTLEESFNFTDEDPNGGVNISDFLENNIFWNATIKSITENRLRAGVQFTANIWYTAMIHAGLTIQAPTLISPSDGSTTTDNTPTFSWTSVSGTSSYDFQLASDNNFTINARTVKGLATTSYTLVNPLTNGGWYWHVRTGDNSADVGLWSQTRSFTISVSTQNPVVVISPSSQSDANGATLTYTVTVTNTENASDNFNLTVSDNASPSWGPTVSPTSLTIPAGENRTATLNVIVPSNAIGSTIDNITATANGTGGSGSGSCTAQVATSRSVSVSISPGSNSGLNGTTQTYTVTINNTGNVSDNYKLENTDNAGWVKLLTKTSLVVPAFSSDNTTRENVTIPSGAIGGTIDNIMIKATSQTDNTVSGLANCTAQITVARSVSVSISPTSQSGANGSTLTYTVTINNTGNVSDNYKLENTDNAGWVKLLTKTSLVVPAFSSDNTTTLSVTVPSNAIGGTIDNVTVTATDNGVSALGSCTAQVTITKGVNTTILPSSQSGSNEAVLTYTVTVANTGNVSDTYNLTATNTAGWPENVSPTSLTVPPFSSGTATLNVTIPENAIGGTIDNIKVTATGTGDNSSANCTAQVTISRGVSVSISPSYQNGTPGSVLSYTVTVNNTGNVSDSYALTVDDNENWDPTLDNNPFENVAPHENKTATLTITIPGGVAPGTEDNITVAASSQAENTLKDNGSCIAHAVMIPWTGTATFRLENLYAISLEEDLWLYQGSKLVAMFYTYGGFYQDNTTLEVFTPTVHMVENENVSRPGNGAIQRVDLAVVDNEGNELGLINIFETSSTVLVSRIGQISALWPFALEAQRTIYISELGAIGGLWPFAPDAWAI